MNRMMIDFETFAIAPNALPLSVGITVFNTEEGIIHEYYNNFNIDRLTKYFPNKFAIQTGTIQWWMRQSEEARDRIFGAHAMPFDAGTILANLASIWQQFNCQELWANGSDFDGPILKNLLDVHEVPQFYPYNALRDARTVYKLFPTVVKSVPFVGAAHDALADAKWQTLALIPCLRIIEGSELPK